MSTNKTPRLNLHSWVGTDYVRRTEFVENFEKIDSSVALLDASGNVLDKAGNILAKKSELTTHESSDSHVQPTERTNWNTAKTNIDNHIVNKSNPHGVTKSQVGLSNVDNVKQATKTEFDNHVSDNTKHVTPTERTNWNEVITNLANHSADKNNPHGVTKAQVGLGSVQNYGISTQAEAEAGTSNSKYMTPLRVKDAITKNLVGVNNHISDYEYQTPTLSGSQIRVSKKSGTSIIKFKLSSNVTGNITISLDNGVSSKPLRDMDGVQLTELEKGFVEVVEDTTFFTLRSRSGLSNADKINIVSDINTLIQM